MDFNVNPPELRRNPQKRNRIHGYEDEFRCSTPNQEGDQSLSLSFPDEMIVEILVRLPAKSLGKFKCCSKPWRSLISSPQFVKTHLAIASGRDGFDHHSIVFELLQRNRQQLKQCSLSPLLSPDSAATLQLEDLDLPREIRRESFSIRGSCNGLLCICVNSTILFLWNPCTKESRELPDIGYDNEETDYHDMVYGFGYDELNDDYKVVSICAVSRGFPCVTEAYVYSLKYNRWSPIGKCKGVDMFVNSAGTFTCGNLHWIAVQDGDEWEKIIIFDLTKETFGEMFFPCLNEPCNSSIGVLGGCLCVLNEYEDFNVEVWVLKEYGVKDSWTKIISVPGMDYPKGFDFLFPVCSLRNGDILLIIDSVLILYCSKSNTFKRYTPINGLVDVDMYIESLVSPDFHDG